MAVENNYINQESPFNWDHMLVHNTVLNSLICTVHKNNQDVKQYLSAGLSRHILSNALSALLCIWVMYTKSFEIVSKVQERQLCHFMNHTHVSKQTGSKKRCDYLSNIKLSFLNSLMFYRHFELLEICCREHLVKDSALRNGIKI